MAIPWPDSFDEEDDEDEEEEGALTTENGDTLTFHNFWIVKRVRRTGRVTSRAASLPTLPMEVV